MNQRNYYGAILNPSPNSDVMAIETVHIFSSLLLLNDWLNDEMLTFPKTRLTSKVFRKVKKYHKCLNTRWVSNKKWMSNLTSFAGGWKYTEL